MTWAITWFYEREVISPRQDKIIQDRFNLVIRSNLIYASRKALNKIFFGDFFLILIIPPFNMIYYWLISTK